MMLEQKDLLAGLNEPQRRAVTTTQGPLLILAGPGSGKTRVITHRIAYLVQYEQVSPWRILAVTFTNKAAREMRERLEKLVGVNESKEMMIGTFHAICARVLRIEADYLAPLGLNRSFVILDSSDQTSLVKQAVRELDLDEKQYHPPVMQSLISRAKNDMQSADQMAEQATKYSEEMDARIYKRYQKLMRANNSVDFDDLLLLTERLWRSEPDVLRKYQQRWQYIHVDEFQDCNLPQYKLIRLLGFGTDERHEGLGNVCVVGDEDQMIYTWRGASAENVQRFERDFPQAKIILLEQNYRSTQTILDAAQNVVKRNKERKDKYLWTALGKGVKITLHEAFDEGEEALYVGHEVVRLLARHDIEKRGDVAVMYRSNSQSRALEEQFMRLNIPYKVIGSRKFYDRKEIKDMLAYLRLLVNPYDDLSLQRIINVPNRKIGPKTLGELQRWANEQHIPLYTAIQRIEEHTTISKAAKQALAVFGQLLIDFENALKERSLPELIDWIAEFSGYHTELLQEPDGDERWSNVLELRGMADDYSEIETRTALELFLENVALVGGADTIQTGEDGTLIKEENKDAVTLITLHAAKGLEFSVVFIVGMDEGSLPHSRSVDEAEQLEEERRLAYVGFTRAMHRLYLVRARRRSYFGHVTSTKPSRFLDDIPPQLITMSGIASSRQSSGERSTANRRSNWDDDYNQDSYSGPETGRVFGSGKPQTSSKTPQAPQWTARPSSNTPPKAPSSLPQGKSSNITSTGSSAAKTPATPPAERPKSQQFKPGDNVRHDTFGEGVVLKSEMEQGTEFVEVQFHGKYGKKYLDVDFAKLEKL